MNKLKTLEWVAKLFIAFSLINIVCPAVYVSYKTISATNVTDAVKYGLLSVSHTIIFVYLIHMINTGFYQFLKNKENKKDI